MEGLLIIFSSFLLGIFVGYLWFNKNQAKPTQIIQAQPPKRQGKRKRSKKVVQKLPEKLKPIEEVHPIHEEEIHSPILLETNQIKEIKPIINEEIKLPAIIEEEKKENQPENIINCDLLPIDNTAEVLNTYDEQKEELDALMAIFSDDFTLINPLTDLCNASFKIFIRSNPSDSALNFSSIYLSITYVPGYPHVPPIFSLINAVNIHKDVIHDIRLKVQSLVEEKSKVSQTMVYDMCDLTQRELMKYNIEPEETIPQPVEVEMKRENSGLLIQEINGEVQKRKKKEPSIPVEINVKHNEEEINLPEPTLSCTISGFEYRRYFEDEVIIGKGGGGSVYKAKNKIDGSIYAIKKIKLKGKKQNYIRYILKEVVLLSKLQHQNIVRYHNAWFEEDESSGSDSDEEESYDSEEESSEEESSSEEDLDENLEIASDDAGSVLHDFDPEASKLYIQMEYCAGDTLRTLLDQKMPSPIENWKMLREILQGLVYVHSKGTIHRDLKPSNIFLNEFGEVKLGDFGLATTTNLKPEKAILKRQVSESLSTGIGTPIYCSPEQKSSGKYNLKTDMYSLGIIFFEMWRPFGSMMQRVEEIMKLREKRILPGDFLETVPKEVPQIIQWLTDPNPDERPSAQELLQSGLLYHRIDPKVFSDFIDISLNPNNSENNMLLHALFEKPNLLKHNFSYNISEGISELSGGKKFNKKIEAMIRANAINKLRTVFNKAGAIEINTPLIMPHSTNITIFRYHKDGAVEKTKIDTSKNMFFLEPSGILVQLNSNLFCPWAKFVHTINIKGVLKRFTISNTYKPLAAGEHPEESLEASIDFCYDPEQLNSFKYLYQAELLKVTLLALEQFGSNLPMLEITVNDTRLLDIILDHCEIPENFRLKALSICRDMQRRKWINVRKDLIDIGITVNSAERLGYYLKLKENLQTLIETIKKNSVWKYNSFARILDIEIKHLEETCKEYNVNFLVDLGLIHDEILCYSGFIFKVTTSQSVAKVKTISKERISIASGGIYDNLIDSFALPSKTNQNKISGIGSHIYIEKIIKIIIQGNTDPWIKGPLVIVTCKTHGQKIDFKTLHHEKINLVLKLWKLDISAVYDYGNLNSDDILQTCKKYRIRFLVTLKCEGEEGIIMASIKDFAKDSLKTIEKELVGKYLQKKMKNYFVDEQLVYPKRS